MTQDKTFNIFLIDGTYQGRISCSAENWAGIAFKIPKTQIENCADIKELNNDGIYFLFNENEVYIETGKLKNIDDFWDDAIFFTNQKNPFDLTGLNFLKNKFSNKITTANSYEVKNNEEIFSENISAEKSIRLEIFAEYMETILYCFGYKIFETPKVEKDETLPITQTQPSKTNENTIFYLKRKVKGKYVVATCQKIFNKYVVLRGSQLAPKLSKDVSENVKAERKKANINENNILMEEVFFDSPSAAGSFVTGTSTRGPEVWKTSSGISLYEFLKRNEIEEKHQ